MTWRRGEMTVTRKWIALAAILVLAEACVAALAETSGPLFVLKADAFRHHVDFFNAMEPENIVNAIPNDRAWVWMVANVPFFACPDKRFEEIYYFRWWMFRKHIKQTPDGFVLTEFLDKVSHSGEYNTISCALGHHVYEGRWLRDDRYLDEYVRFWYTGHDGGLQPHFHQYSNWATWALYRRYLVNQDEAFLVGLLDAFVRDYEAWEAERGWPMACSGSTTCATGWRNRLAVHARPTTPVRR